MAVPVKDSVKINFSGGLNLKDDAKQIDASEFLALNNMVFTTGGRLTKRNGFAGGFTKTVTTPNPALTFSAVPGTLTAAQKVFSYNDELLLNDGFNLYSWDASASAWNYKGRSTLLSVSEQSIVQGVTGYANCDSSTDSTSNVKIFAYAGQANASCRFSIQDLTTGQFILNQSAFGLASDLYEYPRCVSIAGTSYVFAVKFTDHKLYYQKIVGQTVTGSVTALVTLNSTNPFYDVDLDPLSGNLYIAYLDNSGSPKVTISALSNSLVIGNTKTQTATATNGVSWFGDGTNIWVVYATAGVVAAFAVDNAVANITGTAFTIDSSSKAAGVGNVTGVWSSTQNKAFIFYDPITLSGLVTAAAINYNTATIVAGAVTPGTASLFCGSVNLNSKAFAVSGIPHVMGLYAYPSSLPVAGTQTLESIQATNFLLNLYNLTPSMGGGNNNDVPANIAAKIQPDQSITLPPGALQSVTSNPVGGCLPRVYQNPSGYWEMAVLNNSNFGFETQPYSPFNSPAGVTDCQFNFSPVNTDVQVLGNNALFAGGQVGMYDGAIVCEENFHIYPNSVNSSSGISTSGGNIAAVADSLFSYIYLYEWIDNQGQVHRSFPSPVMTPIASGHTYTFAAGTTTGSITLTIPMLRVTNKPGTQVVVNVYRTKANGSVYFLLGVGLVGTYGTVTNDPSINTTTFLDTFSDAQIQGNLQIYTTGDLGFYAPPATSALTNFKNRAIQVSSEDRFQVGYSNAVLQNFPAQFVPEFLVNIGTVGGPLVTVAQMDDKMILFKDGKQSGAAIYYMVGQGPAPSGANNDFQDPLPIAVDAGCVDRPSVVLTPVGLMFKSDKGIYLLDRSLQASYIGAPVESYNQHSVLSAQLIPNTTQVRFLISNGLMLMYDYFYKRWATFSSPAGVSDCIFQGQHTYVSSAGQVYQETPGTYVDGTVTPVLWNFTTAWIKLAGLQGYQRAYFFYFLGDYISSHQLSVSMYTNFSAVADETVTITPDSTKSLENWRVFFKNQRCQSFQISMQEVSTGVLGQGLNLSGLNLIAGVKSKFRTISAAQSTG